MKFIASVALAFLLAGCGGEGSSITSAKPTQRGEANAVNPARNIEVNCQDLQNSPITVNITNNCNKDNATAEPFVAPAE